MELLRVHENVRRGIELLNKEQTGWIWLVQPDFLRMGDSNACVLGQLFGDYQSGVEELWPDFGIDEADDASHSRGFVVADRFSYGFDCLTPWEITREYDKLDRLWRFAIRRMQWAHAEPAT